MYICKHKGVHCTRNVVYIEVKGGYTLSLFLKKKKKKKEKDNRAD